MNAVGHAKLDGSRPKLRGSPLQLSLHRTKGVLCIKSVSRIVRLMYNGVDALPGVVCFVGRGGGRRWSSTAAAAVMNLRIGLPSCMRRLAVSLRRLWFMDADTLSLGHPAAKQRACARVASTKIPCCCLKFLPPLPTAPPPTASPLSTKQSYTTTTATH